MAGQIPDLHAEARTGTGKGAARQARRNGLVPGVVYGGEADPLPINVPFNMLFKKLKEGRFLSTLFNLKVDGQDDVRVICRNVQRDVVKDLPTHIDLLRLKRTTRLDIFIHVDFVNEEEAPGIKKGGVLTVVRPEVELSVIAGNIPEKITVDLDGLEVGDIVHLSDVTLPEGARPTVDRDIVIANISAPSALKSADEDEDEVAADEVETVGEAEAGDDE